MMSTKQGSKKLNSKATLKILLTSALLLASASSAHAVLSAVSPTKAPLPAGNGFPAFYTDTAGLSLDLCLPKNAIQLNQGACLVLPKAQDPIGGVTLPLIFPTNYPVEAFYFDATNIFDLAPGPNHRASFIAALEGTFVNGVPRAADRLVFGRVRIVIDAPTSGTYTVTHPYGTKIFPNVIAGKRAITFTDDIGLVPNAFGGALRSHVGPFLKAATAAGIPKPLVTIGGEQFLSNPNVTTPVTGSPLGTNFFRICVTPGTLDGVNACKTSNQFTLVGKVHAAAPAPAPINVTLAGYLRTAAGAHVDVAATATPAPGSPAPDLFFADAEGTNLMPSKGMKASGKQGEFFGQSIPLNPDALPAAIIVTNKAENPPTSVTANLVDWIYVEPAEYDPATGNMTILATTSDKGTNNATPPQLMVVGLPGSATGAELMQPAGNPLDPAEQKLVYPIPNGAPPVSVTVVSAAGGNADAGVLTLTAGDYPAGGPVAVDQSLTVKVGKPSVNINVLKRGADGVKTTVQIVGQGTHGTATVDASGTVTYTFGDPTFVGDDAFTFTFKDAAGVTSNVGTVTITTVP